MRDEPVFGVCKLFEFAVEVYNLEGDFLFGCGVFELVGSVFDGECFSCSCFAVDEEVAGFFLAERWREYLCECLDLGVSMGNVTWCVV